MPRRGPRPATTHPPRWPPLPAVPTSSQPRLRAACSPPSCSRTSVGWGQSSTVGPTVRCRRGSSRSWRTCSVSSPRASRWSRRPLALHYSRRTVARRLAEVQNGARGEDHGRGARALQTGDRRLLGLTSGRSSSSRGRTRMHDVAVLEVHTLRHEGGAPRVAPWSDIGLVDQIPVEVRPPVLHPLHVFGIGELRESGVQRGIATLPRLTFPVADGRRGDCRMYVDGCGKSPVQFMKPVWARVFSLPRTCAKTAKSSSWTSGSRPIRSSASA